MACRHQSWACARGQAASKSAFRKKDVASWLLPSSATTTPYSARHTPPIFHSRHVRACTLDQSVFMTFRSFRGFGVSSVLGASRFVKTFDKRVHLLTPIPRDICS